MSILFFLILIASAIFIFQDDKEWVEVYTAFESNIGEAQRIYYCLKANGVKCHYQVISSRSSFSPRFQSNKESIVRIQVLKQELDRARHYLLDFRVLNRHPS